MRRSTIPHFARSIGSIRCILQSPTAFGNGRGRVSGQKNGRFTLLRTSGMGTALLGRSWVAIGSPQSEPTKNMKRLRTTITNLKPNWISRAQRASVAGTCSLLLCAAPLLAQQTDENVVSDTGITYSIEADLRGYDGIAAHLIDVATSDGIVTLSGHVDNLLAREQAVTLAKSIKGVRSVINQINVRPVARPDDLIHQDVITSLADDPATDSFEIRVEVAGGDVTLKGILDSWQEKRLAGQIAKGVRGVRSVKNELVFVPTANRPDDEIRNDVTQRLHMDVRINDAGIDVIVDEGKVVLKGLVASNAEKTLAEELSWVSGARDVDSGALEVDFDRMAVLPKLRTDTPDLSDETIAAALRETFKLDPRVKAFAVEPMVRDGIVTLMGKVDNYVAKLAAGRDAKNTVGVTHVINLLKVRPDSLIEDQQLEETVAAALQRNPYLELSDLDVSVRNSRVMLSGEVDNTFEIAEAYRTVARVNGVADISNDLTATTARIPAHGLDHAWNDYVPDAYWPFQEIPKSLDAKIRREVESQLFWSPFLDSDEIEVEVDSGTVKLTGYVDDYAERRIATKNAWEGGARGVLNHLEVR
ncbi:MAG TPA: hypothetical protein DCY13_04435 [Verrucomicrobiales bacterium]|nr:hypothetical protein [Verrucomicrobiales bacterium]